MVVSCYFTITLNTVVGKGLFLCVWRQFSQKISRRDYSWR